MHLDEINKITIPTINSFPHGKLFFNEESPWLEFISIDHTEVAEFEKINAITPKPENLMCTAGILIDNKGEEYDTYAIYSYGEHEGEGEVYFLTIVYIDATFTYDYIKNIWVKWNE